MNTAVDKQSGTIIVAIDGHSSCGKSTLAKDLADALDYLHINTGAMYRAATLFCLNEGIAHDGRVDKEALLSRLDDIKIELEKEGGRGAFRVLLNGEDVTDRIGAMEVSAYASMVSNVPELREKMVASQQMLGRDKGVVMEGRDIGSVVFPDAELKIFMTADLDTRVQRRYEELVRKGADVTSEEVRNNLAARDREDSSRKHNPLVQVPDAKVLDTTGLTREQQLEIALDWAKEAISVY